ncbi:MAG: hypothetical protein ACI8UO_005003 [Verrucomicrobiales bacterium]|jgi:hypothetical protein
MENIVIYLMIGILAIPAVGAIWLWRKLLAPYERRKQETYSREFLERLNSPDFVPIESHFGVSLPEALKSFYSTSMVGDGCDIRFESELWTIAFFEPLDADSLRESWPGCERFVSIANDGFGNDYVFDPTDETAEVLFYDHETGELDKVAPSLTVFLDAVRRTLKTRNDE